MVLVCTPSIPILTITKMIYPSQHNTASLFKAMADLGKLATTDELAAATHLHRRWLMEWLRGMAAAGILEYEKGRSCWFSSLLHSLCFSFSIGTGGLSLHV